MDRNLFFKMVQAQIGYTFENSDLLNQAFTRRSYTEENGGENNEVLEFIGDKVLDLAVVKILTTEFGKIINDTSEFKCDHSEGDLTKLKSRMVEKKTLARRIDELGFSELLLMGNSDIKNNVTSEMSVKEDLFEAILGAVTIDSEWNFAIIQSVVEAMLVPEDFIVNNADDNYVRIIYDWETKVNHVIPWFWFKEKSYPWYAKEENVIYQSFPLDYNYSRIKYNCELKLLNDLPAFCGFGASKSEARMNVCKFAYDYLKKNGYIRYMTMRDEIDTPSKENAINQLEILARRKYFSIPTYEFDETYDNNGNPIWKCTCRIEEYDESFSSQSPSKKEAKKLSALKMLEHVFEKDDKCQIIN